MPILPDTTDILIAGAGPAGVSTSLFLSQYGISHVLIDKAVFPRDKICGDAISGKTSFVLNKLNPDFVKELRKNHSEVLPCHGIRFAAPNNSFVDIPFTGKTNFPVEAEGFISKRLDFDQFLFSKINKNFTTVSEKTNITQIERKTDGIQVSLIKDGVEKKLRTRIIVGAEGDRSVVAKNLSEIKKEDQHYCAGIRAYYKGVTGFHERNFIELHFIKDFLPGYFWIFPLPGGEANVGIGMLSQYVSRKKINLREKLLEVIQTHPEISKRFATAQEINHVGGWGLPLGSLKRKISGDNFILTGDAASLIDPFTGEGIGNAMLSGMHAAQAIRAALSKNRIDSEFLKLNYDDLLYQSLWSELKLSRKLQLLSKHAWLLNLVIKKAARSKALRDTITCMFENIDIRSQLKSPAFYFKLIMQK